MVKNYIKDSLKVFFDYGIAVLIFVFFVYTFFKYLVVYSLVIFLLMSAILYSDMHKLATKEKRPQYNLKPYPLKGLVIGILGFSPFIVVELLYPFIVFNSEVANRIKHLALNTLLSPMYTVLKLGHEYPQSYAIASMVVPIIAALGYAAGFYGFELSVYMKKFKKAPLPESKKTGQTAAAKGKSASVKNKK